LLLELFLCPLKPSEDTSVSLDDDVGEEKVVTTFCISIQYQCTSFPVSKMPTTDVMLTMNSIVSETEVFLRQKGVLVVESKGNS
jgi:hypothetical protein